MPSQRVACKDIDGKVHVVSIDELRWRPSVYAIVIKDGAVLLSPQFNGYDLPGGGIELGEMPEDALVREVKEETGIIVNKPQLLVCESSFFKLPSSSKGQYVQSLLLYYKCDYVGGELSMDGFTEDEKKFSRFPEWHLLEDGEIKIARSRIAASYDWRTLVKQIAKP